MRMRVAVALGLLVLVIMTALPVQAQLRDGERLLAWVAPVTDPFARRNSDQMGQIGFVNDRQEFESIQDVPADTNRIAPCGAGALSEDGKHFAFIMGNDKSPRGLTLYMVNDGNQPQRVADIQAVGCLGANGRFQYSPDSRRFGFISYPSNWSDSSYALGDVSIRQTDGLGVDFNSTTGGVVAFDLTNDGVSYLRFIQNSQSQAIQAEVNLWTSGQPRVPVTINAAQNCRYVSGFILDADEDVWIGLAERCSQTEWQLFRMNKDAQNAVLALTAQARGAFTGGAQTHNLFLSNDGDHLFYSLPSGRTQNSIDLFQLPINDTRSPQPVIEADAMTLDYSGSVDAPPALSPDGKWLAFVARDGNASFIQIVNLDDATQAPSSIRVTTSQSDSISWLAFTPDSSEVVYIAGRDKLAGNTLYHTEVGQTSAQTITAGTFSQWGLISPSNNEIAILEWQPTPEGRPAIPSYLNLVLVNLEDGERQLIFDGLVINASDEASVRFAMPLLWER